MALHTAIAAVLGVLILHPLTALVYGAGVANAVFGNEMLPMSLTFALIGGAIGLAFGRNRFRTTVDRQTIRSPEHQLTKELPRLTDRGERAQLELKSWLCRDSHQQRANRRPQQVVDRTISGFLNKDGGALLIDDNDSGGNNMLGTFEMFLRNISMGRVELISRLAATLSAAHAACHLKSGLAGGTFAHLWTDPGRL